MSPTTLDWLVVGGGIHGVHLTVQLLSQAGVEADRIRILDPAPRLLESWRRRSRNTGMRFLRSPAVHHLDVDPWGLLSFAGANRRGRGAAKGLFASPYERPSVALFAKHCQKVIDDYGLSKLHIQDKASKIELGCDHALVHLESGASLQVNRVVLAMGGGPTRWPAWARALKEQGHRVQHVFEANSVLRPNSWPKRVAVIGGGISAAQVALRFADGEHEVHLFSRHELEKQQFDSDSGWVGPKNMRRFTETQDLAERRAMIQKARHTGSLPPDVYRELRAAIRAGKVHWHLGELQASGSEDGIALTVNGHSTGVDAVLLATGFESARPGGDLIDSLIEDHALPCAACGYPVVNSHLQWHPAVLVTGPLAELTLGPVSRNIVGARRAAECIVAVGRTG